MLGCPTCCQLLFLDDIIRKNQIDFPFQFHLFSQLPTVDEHIQGQGLFVLQEQIAPVFHVSHTCHTYTHLGGMTLAHKETSGGNQIERRKMQDES